MATTEVPSPPATEATTWHVLSREGVAQELHVEPGRGLTSEEAAQRLSQYGPNRFAEAKTESRVHAFLRQYRDPMQIVLLVAGVISIYPVKQPATGVVILLLTLLNAVLGLNQEGKAATARSRSCRPRSSCPETWWRSRPATWCPRTGACSRRRPSRSPRRR